MVLFDELFCTDLALRVEERVADAADVLQQVLAQAVDKALDILV